MKEMSFWGSCLCGLSCQSSTTNSTISVDSDDIAFKSNNDVSGNDNIDDSDASDAEAADGK